MNWLGQNNTYYTPLTARAPRRERERGRRLAALGSPPTPDMGGTKVHRIMCGARHHSLRPAHLSMGMAPICHNRFVPFRFRPRTGRTVLAIYW